LCTSQQVTNTKQEDIPVSLVMLEDRSLVVRRSAMPEVNAASQQGLRVKNFKCFKKVINHLDHIWAIKKIITHDSAVELFYVEQM